jgi:hypothetical protein
MRPALAIEMMERLGMRATQHMKNDDQVDSELMPTSISSDYQTLISECFIVMGLSTDLVRVSVRPVGRSTSGLEIYAAFIKVQRWEPCVIQMLTRMPVIEKKIEKRLKQANMHRYSQFAGLWFRTPSKLEAAVGTVH